MSSVNRSENELKKDLNTDPQKDTPPSVDQAPDHPETTDAQGERFEIDASVVFQLGESLITDYSHPSANGAREELL